MTKKDAEKLLDNNKYQVFLFASGGHLPFGFAAHPWFVINKKGDISRWEVLFRKNQSEYSWGHLHKDHSPPFKGISTLPFFSRHHRKGRVLGFIEGDENSMTKKLIDFIENSPKTYKYSNIYRLIGPNSNTYVQWVLDHFPEFPVKLPCNAYGKDFKTIDKR